MVAVGQWDHTVVNTDNSGWRSEFKIFILENRPRYDGVYAVIMRAGPDTSAWFHIWVRHDDFAAQYDLNPYDIPDSQLEPTVQKWIEKKTIVPLCVNHERHPKVWGLSITPE